VYLSLDPTNRVWINEADSYLPAVKIGEVMRGGTIGEVVESRNDAYPVGSTVMGLLGWQEYAVVGGDTTANVIPPGLPMREMMSVYGATGLTAYFGMLDVAQPKAGETVVISGAAGAVGSIAGQIGKIQGCRVVGLAGTEDKCCWVEDDLGFDACINYKTENIGTRLAELCPDGVDVYFDNVGGSMLDTVLLLINIGARVALCGAISAYNSIEAPEPIHWYMNLVAKRARMEGFLILDYLERFPEGVMQMAQWVADGRVKWRDQVVDGLENAPQALNMLFTGENTGKLLVQIAPEPA
jgi:NADPH-dependent curcumin reductase CurA